MKKNKPTGANRKLFFILSDPVKPAHWNINTAKEKTNKWAICKVEALETADN